MRVNPIVIDTEQGLYCPSGGFHIDPRRAVDIAVVTHAHSDHARRGSQLYYCVDSGEGLLRCRLGAKINVQSIPYGEKFRLGQAWVSFHSAGHILGSAQVRIEVGSEVWVVSGDYKRDADPSCAPFEPVECDVFLTEATFGTPSYVWPKNQQFGKDIIQWWRENRARGYNSILFGYSLGKTQRILAELAAHAERPVLIHSAAVELTECYRRQSIALAPTLDLEAVLQSLGTGEILDGELILAPPAITRSEFASALGDFETAFASGWMQTQRTTAVADYQPAYQKGFVMSDHADWEDLNRTIDETGAHTIYVLHRGNGALVKHLRSRGKVAHPIKSLWREPSPQLSLF